MQLYEKRNIIRWIIILTSFFIVVLIVWNTYAFFKIFKTDERIKMQHWATATKTIDKADLDSDITLPLEIIQSANIPIIVTDKDSVINTLNVEEAVQKNPAKLKVMLEHLKSQNDPIVMHAGDNQNYLLYYGDSDLLNKLKYYPIALLLIIILFAAVVYNFYTSNKMATQNKLWAGMAKETAHQIGTPLSSLIGWLEIMKAEEIDAGIITEIEKDIQRLQTIANRFSKIGSEPLLEKYDIIAETKQSFDYLKSRFSSQIEFDFESPKHAVYALINPELQSWTIENLIKNAIDAMKGAGKLSVKIIEDHHTVKINVSDTGKGIPKNQFKRVFEPGFTTKKRGWGLGLSLTKRIVESYHKGTVKVLHSEVDKGTIMQICYKKLE
ncbi:sensor histidine kinase [Flavobacterium croceum]|uniref:histidine kinase n=1 Tax=Flavobacterium croceum DSM 17960 TaxID=1121886 RepID=A0A2S4NBQ0_9FLAO|nr:HAMP domain-containing sensor histidine kinase [Flavobacterium croceum]POS03134.1 histidine kinase/DNA gyrase B/HSP90-like ATPase [Flavobacterium croceum DSM 17960]